MFRPWALNATRDLADPEPEPEVTVTDPLSTRLMERTRSQRPNADTLTATERRHAHSNPTQTRSQRPNAAALLLTLAS